MTGRDPVEPGDRAGRDVTAARRLERAPGERYAAPEGGPSGEARGGAFMAPVAKALVAALVGALLLYTLGALLSSSAGLVFVAGLAGAAIGLLIARAAAPGGGRAPALTRRGATWLALGLAVAAVLLGTFGTWLHALAEGGALGFVDYVLETFGAIVPLELLVAAIAAAWGAGAGPIER